MLMVLVAGTHQYPIAISVTYLPCEILQDDAVEKNGNIIKDSGKVLQNVRVTKRIQ
jgi:hypothetical protein